MKAISPPQTTILHRKERHQNFTVSVASVLNRKQFHRFVRQLQQWNKHRFATTVPVIFTDSVRRKSQNLRSWFFQHCTTSMFSNHRFKERSQKMKRILWMKHKNTDESAYNLKQILISAIQISSLKSFSDFIYRLTVSRMKNCTNARQKLKLNDCGCNKNFMNIWKQFQISYSHNWICFLHHELVLENFRKWKFGEDDNGNLTLKKLLMIY